MKNKKIVIIIAAVTLALLVVRVTSRRAAHNNHMEHTMQYMIATGHVSDLSLNEVQVTRSQLAYVMGVNQSQVENAFQAANRELRERLLIDTMVEARLEEDGKLPRR